METATNQPDPNDDLPPLVHFFESRTFKRICFVLIVIAIVYGILAGTLTSSRVPNTGSTIKPNIGSVLHDADSELVHS